MSVNESDIFEENNLYIQGITLKNTILNTHVIFNSMFTDIFQNEKDLDDIYADLEYKNTFINFIVLQIFT